MRLFSTDIADGLQLAERVNTKYKPVFDKLPSAQRAALAWYFLPHKSNKQVLNVTRPGVVKWFCPFADQKQFPSGHRYCINVYAGCSHGCKYCYAQSYEPDQARCKDNYKRKLLKDLADIAEFNLPPAPVHLSNSTDAFQPLELRQKLSLYTLQQLHQYRHCFTTITILTKNPAVLTEPEYLKALKALASLPADYPRKDLFNNTVTPPLRVEISLVFWNEDSAAFYDPGAPPVAERAAAIKRLRQSDIPVVLRIDPLLPRNPLPPGKLLADFNLPDAQSLPALEKLVSFAADNGVSHIVYSVAKIVLPRYKPADEITHRLKHLYEHVAQPDKLIFRGGSWRLPDNIARKHIVKPFLEICDTYALNALFCKQNLLTTP